MNKHRKQQIVSSMLVTKCRKWAFEYIDYLAQSPERRRYLGEWGADKDPVRLTNSKVGECAVALYFRLDPLTKINWIMRADTGFDLKLPNGLLPDVKTTQANRKLIWSRACNDVYHERKFDVLISCTIDSLALPGDCWIEGYVSKEDFFRTKNISDGSDGLSAGTWNLPKSALSNIDNLRVQHWRQPPTYRCRCGEIAHYGFGVNIRDDQSGTWYCKEHKP